MSSLFVTAIGVGAAGCSMASFVPQAVKVIKDHDATSVSLGMYVVTVIGFTLWSAYGAFLHSWPLVLSNLICLALSVLILGLKIRYPGASSAS